MIAGLLRYTPLNPSGDTLAVAACQTTTARSSRLASSIRLNTSRTQATRVSSAAWASGARQPWVPHPRGRTSRRGVSHDHRDIDGAGERAGRFAERQEQAVRP